MFQSLCYTLQRYKISWFFLCCTENGHLIFEFWCLTEHQKWVIKWCGKILLDHRVVVRVGVLTKQLILLVSVCSSFSAEASWSCNKNTMVTPTTLLGISGTGFTSLEHELLRKEWIRVCKDAVLQSNQKKEISYKDVHENLWLRETNKRPIANRGGNRAWR